MEVFTEIATCRDAVGRLKELGKTVAVVPTMGALHAGHLALMAAARNRAERLVVTLFVNPTQFAPGEDFSKYPRTFEADSSMCRSAGVDLLFAPSVAEMYPTGGRTTVHVAEVGDGLCGPFRPGHFDGVATVVAKLLNIVPADYAFFGEKDYQQLVLIRRMARDLNLPVEIVGHPTVREPDGLALSSRNVYLRPDERSQATSLSSALFAAAAHVRGGERDSAQLTGAIRSRIRSAGPAEIEYVEVVDAETLAPVTILDRPARICLAVRIGQCRLIDNIDVDVPLAGS